MESGEVRISIPKCVFLHQFTVLVIRHVAYYTPVENGGIDLPTPIAPTPIIKLRSRSLLGFKFGFVPTRSRCGDKK